MYDRRNGAIGLGHAGWRGTVKGMAAALVSALRKAYGSRPDEIEVVLGPAISGRNYRVDDDIVGQADDYFGEDSGMIWRDPADNAPHLELWAANRLDLQRSGVTNITTLDICTFENTDEFFSHRAEAGATGRFGVVISL